MEKFKQYTKTDHHGNKALGKKWAESHLRQKYMGQVHLGQLQSRSSQLEHSHLGKSNLEQNLYQTILT